MRTLFLYLVLSFALVTVPAFAGGKYPWQRRYAKNVEINHRAAHRKIPPELWPPEPKTPADLEEERFKTALSTLCGRMPDERLQLWTRIILDSAKDFQVDPFLLGALIYDQSRCRPATPKRDQRFGRFGLTRIPVEMHKPHVRRGVYRYYDGQVGNWIEKKLEIGEYPFNQYKAAKARSNVYFASAIIKVLNSQDGSLRMAFKGIPYRHPISRWFYGDWVRETAPENRVLTVRRRFIEIYRGTERSALVGEFEQIPLVSPLDGVPRMVIDYFGNPRGRKDGYGHRGIDLDGVTGEPVRAIAAGKVSFSGVDIPGALKSQELSIEASADFPRSEMGPGGYYVAIKHEGGFGTIYMHLDSIAVGSQQLVEAGDIIGTLGRSGTEKSGPHLHLEFRRGTSRVDPAVYLSDILVDPYSGDASFKRAHRLFD